MRRLSVGKLARGLALLKPGPRVGADKDVVRVLLAVLGWRELEPDEMAALSEEAFRQAFLEVAWFPPETSLEDIEAEGGDEVWESPLVAMLAAGTLQDDLVRAARERRVRRVSFI